MSCIPPPEPANHAIVTWLSPLLLLPEATYVRVDECADDAPSARWFTVPVSPTEGETWATVYERHRRSVEDLMLLGPYLLTSTPMRETAHVH